MDTRLRSMFGTPQHKNADCLFHDSRAWARLLPRSELSLAKTLESNAEPFLIVSAVAVPTVMARTLELTVRLPLPTGFADES